MESIPTDGEPTDEDLLGRLSSDPAAFEVFYRRHVDRHWRVNSSLGERVRRREDS
jgi:hypothetical protein